MYTFFHFNITWFPFSSHIVNKLLCILFSPFNITGVSFSSNTVDVVVVVLLLIGVVWVSLLVGVVLFGLSLWAVLRAAMRYAVGGGGGGRAGRRVKFVTALLYGWGALLERPPPVPSVSVTGRVRKV